MRLFVQSKQVWLYGSMFEVMFWFEQQRFRVLMGDLRAVWIDMLARALELRTEVGGKVTFDT